MFGLFFVAALCDKPFFKDLGAKRWRCCGQGPKDSASKDEPAEDKKVKALAFASMRL